MRPYRRIICVVFFIVPALTQSILSQTNISPDQKFLNALHFLGKQQTEKAVSELEELIAKNPEYSNAYRTLSGIYISSDDLSAGERYFRNLIKNNPANAFGHYGLARINFYQNKKEKALQSLKKCIKLDPEFVETYGPFEGIADVFQSLKQIDQAVLFFENLIKNNPENVNAYYGLGRSYLKANEKEKALETLNSVLAKNPDHKYANHELIYIYESTGKYEQALEACKKLIDICTQNFDLAEAAYGYSKFGGIYFFMGDYQSALLFFNKALQVSTEIGSFKYKSLSINNIGAVYATLGDFAMARKYFIHSLDLMEKDGVEGPKIRILLNIGLISKDLKDNEEGLRYLKKGLALARKTGLHFEKAALYSGLGEIYLDKKDYKLALENFNAGYAVANEVKDIMYQGYIARNLGSLYLETGSFPQAVDFFSKALFLGNEMKDAQIRWESEAGLGTAYKGLNQLSDAEYHLTQAIAIFDSIRQNLDFETLGSAFLADKYEAYPSLIQLYTANEQYDKAFTILEKYKASTLLKLITKGQPLLNSLLPDSVRVNLQKINDKLVNYHHMLSQTLSKGQPDEHTILELDQKIKALELQKTNSEAWLKKNYQAFYQITSAKPLTLTDSQKDILSKNQVILEYVVAPNSIGIMAISSDKVVTKEIDLSRQQLKDLFNSLSPIFKTDESGESTFKQSLINADMADFSVSNLAYFYETLIKPVESILDGKTDLIIVPDDLLYYLPFEALVVDTTQTENRYDFSNAKFLIEKYAISYATSVSSLSPDFQQIKESKYDLLAFGNPDYSTLHASSQADSSQPKKFVEQFIQLPNSEREVKLIGEELNRNNTQILTGFAASENEFKLSAQDFRILHLATHFVMNDVDPLYSRIVLSKDKQSSEDGYLQPYEIFHLKLNAELVVLSACNTASGKLNKGEGLVGLTRAFQYAGIPSMVVSLWNVDDRATSDIMRYFYAYLQDGLNKNQALRMAKIDYLNHADSDKKDPFYWAPFIFIGDIDPLNLDKPFPFKYFYILAGMAFIIAVIVFIRRKKYKPV